MNALTTFHLLTFLYWGLLLSATIGSLVFAVLAAKLHRQPFAIASAGALAGALFIAAIPAQSGPGAFGVLLGMLALALAVVGGGPVAVLALNLATKNSVPPGAHGGILIFAAPPAAPPARNDQAASNDDLAVPAPERPVQEVLRGGLAIGVLERLAVAGAILAGFPEAIAIVVAVKGVGRFTELAAAESRERFIIGTLASLIWACACAALAAIAIG
ncbi:MAG: hypothetical protein R6W83_06760 [Cryobacterium sp.]